MSDENLQDNLSDSNRVFDFYYEKGPGYRSIHADGFIVSPNAKGAVAITFYSERIAIPKQVRIDFNKGEDPDEEIVDGKKGIFRQIEATAFIDTDTAEELRDWLSKAISAIDDDNQEEPGASDE